MRLASRSAPAPEPEATPGAALYNDPAGWLAGLSTSSSGFAENIGVVFQVLHLVYEDLKLNVLTASETCLRPLVALLFTLARRLSLLNHADHYLRDFGEILQNAGQTTKGISPEAAKKMSVAMMATVAVPSVYRWLHDSLQGLTLSCSLAVQRPGVEKPPAGSELCTNTRRLCYLYSLLAEGDHSRTFRVPFRGIRKRKANATGPSRTVSAVPLEYVHELGVPTVTSDSHGDGDAFMAYTASSVDQKVLLGMVSVGINLAGLECLPIGVALPLREAIWSCRHQPPLDWPTAAYIIMGREDLASTVNDGQEMEQSKSSTISTIGWSASQAKRGNPNGTEFGLPPDMMAPAGDGTKTGAAAGENSSCDGTELGTKLPFLRFGRDQRLKEVQRILGSSRPGPLRLVRAPETSDHEYLEQQQKKLQLLAQRTMAIAVGRGMFTLYTSRPTVTDPLPIPPLNLSGRLPPNDAITSLDVSSLPGDLQKWPCFHNGVAAGLRLPRGQSHATRTWIVYNKPQSLTDEHAGVLMALGLSGQLSSLASADLVWYLSQRHETTAVGVMLGMAAARCGSMDNTISKMLCMHILAFHPPTFPELDVSSNLQTAAIMGIGLLYQGTANRFMTEVLLGEIGRRASDSIAVDREGYSLAAGFALGLVTLGSGNKASGLTGALKVLYFVALYLSA
jgi:anaphase-promoting complex subunit 1